MRTLAVLEGPPADAAISLYARWSRTTSWGVNRAAVTLRTWGYIDDRCIQSPQFAGCFRASDWRVFRP